MPTTNMISNSVSSPIPQPPSDRCVHTDSASRRCRALTRPGHPSLCGHHARQLSGTSDPAPNVPPVMTDLTREIFGSLEELQSAAALNHVLARLLVLIAANRIPVRNASVIAYVSQLLLQTLPGLDDEIREVSGYDAVHKHLREVLAKLPPLSSVLDIPDAAEMDAS